MAGSHIDRLVSVHLFRPLARMGICKASSGIPVLMYHSISEGSETGVSPYYRTATRPDVFDSHMHYLHAHGYSVLNLGEAVDALETDSTRWGKCAVITFDDGFRDFYTNAFPILKKYSFTATMFVPTGLINERAPFKGKPVMTWDEIRELKGQGIQFGSHTVTHPELQGMPLQDVKYELELSKAHLEEQLNESITTFCYPYAFPEENTTFTRALKEIMVNAGYRYATGTRVGTLKKADDPYFIKRIPVNSCDDSALLEAKLHGAYDWLYHLQWAFKNVKKWKRNMTSCT
jgi:peptidoglycan/xylan/chitin deacetylase (PgdA/CDA1 family)